MYLIMLFLPVLLPDQPMESLAPGSPAFVDPNIPADFAPFNVAIINGFVYVLYAKKNGADDQAGPGNGFIDKFTAFGSLVKRFASNGVLNSPWGIISTSSSHGCNSGDILVGNFGDGRINVFNSDGIFLRQLQKCDGTALIIDGLWGLATLMFNPSSIYFASGPLDEAGGLVGFLTKCTCSKCVC